MTTYYVRKTGNDAAAGTSAGAAWLTFSKALTGATPIVSGDTLYIGAGVYRESQITIGFTPVSTVFIVGDTDGSQTGDAGLIIMSGWLVNDQTAPSAVGLMAIGTKRFITFQNIVFMNTASIFSITAGGTDITFTRCVFKSPNNVSALTATFAVDAAANILFDSCIFWSGGGTSIVPTVPTSTIADYDLNITIKNSISMGGVLCDIASSGANTFKGGGFRVYNCTHFPTGAVGQMIRTPTLFSTTFPVVVANCLMGGSGQGLNAGVIGQIVEDYNIIQNITPRTNMSIGPFTVASSTARAPMLSTLEEALYGLQLRPMFSPIASGSTSSYLGFGNVTLASGYSATITDDATVGTIAWTNPTNASLPEGTNLAVATAIPLTTGISHYLNAQGFTGFAGIPSDATIKSIRVELLVSAEAASAIACSSVKLLKAGVITGNDLFASNATQFTTSLVAQSWGNTSDPLWGTTWSVAEVQAAGFGCVWAAKNTSGTNRACNIDFIRVIVAYTLVDGSGGVAVDILNRPRPAGGASTAYAVGALERHDTGTRELAITDGGTGSSLKQTGPSDSEFQIPVDAIATTISVKFETASYVGTNYPQIILLASNDIGVSTQTITASGTSDGAFATLTFAAITPTAKGIVTVRLRNRTNDGAGIVYWDSFRAI